MQHKQQTVTSMLSNLTGNKDAAHATQETYRSDDVRSQQPISDLISKDFHKSIGIIVGLSPAIRSKGKFANLVFNTLESKK
jgi:hypothetical protein